MLISGILKNIDWDNILNKPSTFTPSAHTHDAGDVISGFFANERISESNVTQHEGAITHNNLNGLQGGQADEYYHLTSTEHSNLQSGYLAIDGSNANTNIDVGSYGIDAEFFRVADGKNIYVGDDGYYLTYTDALGLTLCPDGGTSRINLCADAVHFGIGDVLTDNIDSVTIAQLRAAYDHSQDNTQAHTDYLINNGDDETSGSLKATTFKTGAFTLTIDETASLTYYMQNLGDDTTPTLSGNLDGQSYNISTTGTYNNMKLYGDGAGNTVVGVNAGSVLDSSHNTLVGSSAGYILDSSGNNTYIGYQAGYTDEVGGQNTGVGAYALHTCNYVGDVQDLVAVGYNALRANTTGSDSVAVGSNSLVSNTTGWFNVGVGYGALADNTTGQYNVGIGTDTNRYNETGSSNTIIGHYAGKANVNKSGSVFLGYYAGYYETASNKFFIDNQDRTNEADSRTKSLIYGLFDANPSNQTLDFNVGIATFLGDIYSTGKAVLEGESIFGKTTDSMTDNEEFDNGTTDWDTVGTWATGDDAGDYYVSISQYAQWPGPVYNYIQQLSIGVVVGKTYKLVITYDFGSRTCKYDFGGKTNQSLSGDGGKKTDTIYITATSTNGLKLYPEEDDNPTKYYKAEVTLMNEVEIANLNVLNTTFLSLASSTAAGTTGEEALSLGHETIASGQYSFAINESNTASGKNSFAGGDTSTATGTNSFAFGNLTDAIAGHAIAMGNQATASGSSSLALGGNTSATGISSVALGDSATATANYALALGRQADASAVYATALGYQSTASGITSVAIGAYATASGYTSVAMGGDCVASELRSFALGTNVNVSDEDGVGIGNGVNINSGIEKVVAIGVSFSAVGLTEKVVLGVDTEKIRISSNSVVFNELSNDVDHRFEGATDTNLLVLNGGNDSLTVGGDLSNAKFNVNGTSFFNDSITIADAKNIILNTTTGTKIGTATAQKLSFYNATPVNQPDTVSDAATQDIAGSDTVDETKVEADLTSCKNAINTIISRLKELGLIA